MCTSSLVCLSKSAIAVMLKTQRGLLMPFAVQPLMRLVMHLQEACGQGGSLSFIRYLLCMCIAKESSLNPLLSDSFTLFS